jgi:thiol:disulfide interchange protein DsbD
MVDAYFKGMMATILATPCSGPFLGSTLAWALTQPATVVFLIFLFVGLGMAAPYTLLTANPALLRFVPKPGPWMQTFKHLMGFLLMGTVVFLMVSLKQDLHVFTVSFLVFVGLACWLWGRYATFDQTAIKRLGTLVSTLGVLVVGAWLSFVTMREFFAGPG